MKLVLNKNINWIVIFLFSFFITEAIYKLLLIKGLGDYRIAGLTKLVAQFYMVYVILKKYKDNKKSIFLLGTLFFIYIIGQILLPINQNIINNLEYFNKSIFTILLLLFYNNINLTKYQKSKTLKYFEVIIIINSIAAIIGYVFEINYLMTYSSPRRFGYDGFLVKQSFASYFYLISYFYFLHEVLVLKKRKVIKLILVTTVTIITGTKGALLAFLLISLVILYKKKLLFNLKFLIGSILILLITIYFVFNFTSIVESTTHLFLPIIEDHGILTALFSHRNLILQNQLIPFIFDHWKFFNVFFGGMGDIMIRCGLDFIDLFYFFGILGCIVYFNLVYNVFHVTKPSIFYIYFAAIIIIVMALGGNLFYNSSVAVYLCIIKLYFEFIKENENKNS